jgi:hypothetical protein
VASSIHSALQKVHPANITPSATQSASTTQSRSATDTTGGTQAPAGTAESYAAKLGSLVGVSHTSATASGTGTSSTANPLEIGGQPLSGQFGGTQSGAGSKSGALLDTGPSSQFRLAVTPWSVSNTQSPTQSTASAVSDILSLDLGDPTTATSASVRVLQSQAGATWTPTASTSGSSSDGALISLGGPSGLNLDVLHSGTGSSGSGSFLASVNGTQIGSSSQTNGACSLTLPSLLSLNCLTGTSGTGGGLTDQAASVVGAVLGSGPNALGIGAITSTSSAGTAPASSGGDNGGNPPGGGGNSATSPSTPAGTVHATSAPIVAGPAAAASPALSQGSGNLAFTGTNVWALIALSLLLLVGGATAVVAARRRHPAL